MSSKIRIEDINYSSELRSIYDAGFCFPETAVFIKEDEYNGKIYWGIYDADGVRIAVTDDRECAFMLAKQNDLLPQSAH
jgi:hypothetical protein